MSDLKIVYDDVLITLGALGSKAAIQQAGKIDSARENGFRVVKTEYWISYEGKTSGQGPIMIGCAFNTIVASSEIENAIEADPQNSFDVDGNERPMRPIFPLEMVPATVTSDIGPFCPKGTFNPRWTAPEGGQLSWWAYNMDSAALDSGTLVHIFAKHYGVWLSD